MTEIAFDVFVPYDKDLIIAQIKENRKRNLREAHTVQFEFDDRLKIIASGPSARNAPLDGQTVAVNNSLRLFLEAGTYPTFYAACDPQPEIADFLTNPPKETIYFIASKCHPSVFEALKDRKVIMWHMEEGGYSFKDTPFVPTSMSITGTAISLFRAMGFTGFDVYGWDCSYSCGQSHMFEQPHEPSQHIQVMMPDGRFFDTNPTWAAEAQDATYLIALYGYDVNIHGDGLLPAVVNIRLPIVRQELGISP